jgi:N-ethylmaleimide reductase
MSLFNAIQIGSLTAKNRIVLAPMTRARFGEDGVPKELNAEYFKQRSSAGLLITDATGISKEGLGWWLAPGIFSDTQVEGWKTVTKVHDSGSLIYLQLWHMVNHLLNILNM